MDAGLVLCEPSRRFDGVVSLAEVCLDVELWRCLGTAEKVPLGRYDDTRGGYFAPYVTQKHTHPSSQDRQLAGNRFQRPAAGGIQYFASPIDHVGTEIENARQTKPRAAASASIVRELGLRTVDQWAASGGSPNSRARTACEGPPLSIMPTEYSQCLRFRRPFFQAGEEQPTVCEKMNLKSCLSQYILLPHRECRPRVVFQHSKNLESICKNRVIRGLPH